LDNLITLGQTPIGSHQSPVGALRHLSPLQCSRLVPALDENLGIHPAHDGAKTHPWFPSVKSKCTALLNQKHGRFRRIRVLASALALRLTTYYHVPEYFG